MKSLFLSSKCLVSVVVFFLLLSIPLSIQAQFDFNKLKKQKTETKTEAKKEQPSGNFKAMRTMYEARTAVTKSWPNTIYSSLDFSPYIQDIQTLDMAQFEKEMNEHKSKHSDLFLFYDLGELPTGMQKAPNTRKPWETDDDRYWINDAIVKYYKWKDKLTEQRQDLAQLANNHISNAESAQSGEKIEKAILAVNVIAAIKSIQPDNPQISDLERRSSVVLDKAYDDVKHLITGDMHKKNFKKIVGYSSKPVIGKEDSSTVTTTITPGKPFYLVGYFSNKIKDLDLKGHIGGIPVSKTPLMEWKQVGNESNFGRMQMYWNEEMMKTVKENSFYMFEMFPDIATVNFKSHVEYLPIMHFAKWLTYQMPGTYQFYIKFSDGSATSVLAENTFTVNLTNESITELKKYYEQLAQKKLSAVTFNNAAGCNNQAATIGKKDEMNKYGELIKVTCKETGKVMQPWPREHLVEYFTGAGYGIFKHPDGKYEVIKLTFRRPATSNQFSFYGAELMNHYEIEGSTPIKSVVLKYGYEIPQENINKCTMW